MFKGKQKIGLCLTTYNREEYYKKVLSKIPRHKLDYFVVVSDGTNHYANLDDADKVILCNKRNGVSRVKNLGISILLEQGCEHIFTMDDDMLIKDENLFDAYIESAYMSGIYHLNYERCAGNEKNLLYRYEMPSGHSFEFFRNPQAPFTYTLANIYKKFGMLDEEMVNSFEHISFAYTLVKEKLLPAFWYFPDIGNSADYLEPIEGSDENSSITNKEDYDKNWRKSAERFVKVHGKFTNEIPFVNEKEFLENLSFIENTYSRKYMVSDKKMGIVVPYRDREKSLEEFKKSIGKYLEKQVENCSILVVEQGDEKPFNKGLLNNYGYLLLKGSCDYVCFHDVDLLPLFCDYSYPKKPSHLSSHCSQFNYVNIPDKIMGGVITFKNEDFWEIGGYPNDFVGWGKEDDMLYFRCEQKFGQPYKHPLGKFWSVPHQHRLSSQKEYEYHAENGKRFQLEISGKKSSENNGVKSIKLEDVKISEISSEMVGKFPLKHLKLQF